MEVLGIDYTFFGVADMEKSLAFYRARSQTPGPRERRQLAPCQPHAVGL